MKFDSEVFRRSIQNSFFTAMIMGFLWSVFGNFLPFGVVNFFLQFGIDPRQPLVAGIFFAIIVAVGSYLRESIRQTSLTSVMRFQDFEHRQDVQKSDLGQWADLEVFNNWHKAENHFEGRFLEEPVTMVDFTTVSESEEGNTYATNTLILLSEATSPVPEFELRNRTFFSELIMGMFGGKNFMPKERILIPTGISSENSHLVEQFNHSYYPPAASDEVTHLLLSAETLACLARKPGWSVECRHGRMALWYKKRLVSAETRLEALKQAVEIKRGLLAPVQKTSVEQSSNTSRSPLFQIHEIKAGSGTLAPFGGFILGSFVGMSLIMIVAPLVPFFGHKYFMSFFFLNFFGMPLYGIYYGFTAPRRWRIAKLYKSRSL